MMHAARGREPRKEFALTQRTGTIPAATSRLAMLAATMLVAGCSMFGIRDGTESPSYEVVGMVGEAEIRQYAPRIAAQTIVEGAEEPARSAGFRKVAGYIFGGNRTRADIAMTAPVVQSAAPSREIAMTAPVVAQAAGEGKWAIRFIMPAQYTMATLPEPLDAAVTLVSVPAETMAVIRFTGSRSAAAMADGRGRLRQALAGSAWTMVGDPVDWFYDPPWTLPFLRRNEVAVPVMARVP